MTTSPLIRRYRQAQSRLDIYAGSKMAGADELADQLVRELYKLRLEIERLGLDLEEL